MSKPQNLFERLGGIRGMADLLGKPPSTVQSWKNVGRVPAHEQPDVLAKAEAAGIAVTAQDVVFPMGLPDAAPATESAEA